MLVSTMQGCVCVSMYVYIYTYRYKYVYMYNIHKSYVDIYTNDERSSPLERTSRMPLMSAAVGDSCCSADWDTIVPGIITPYLGDQMNQTMGAVYQILTLFPTRHMHHKLLSGSFSPSGNRHTGDLHGTRLEAQLVISRLAVLVGGGVWL